MKHRLDPSFKGRDDTICEHLRRIYRAVERGEVDKIKPLVEIAYDMAKRMHKRLVHYRKTVDGEIVPEDE